MSKTLNPGRKPVALAPSRIRREPPKPEKVVLPRSDEKEIWFGVVGVVVTAAVLMVLGIGISIATVFRDADPAESAFAQCYSSSGINCVIDGDTVFVDRARIEIGGIAAPRIKDAQCEAERASGIAAALELARLLNTGKVTLGAVSSDEKGRTVQAVRVAGKDVGETMIAAGLAHRPDSSRNWCSQAA